MLKHLGSFVLLFSFAACGGTSETGSGQGGSSQGGSAQGGNGTSGSSSAGKSMGGSVNVAGSNAAGSVGEAGSVSAGGTGGSGAVDPRCPPQRPMGQCEADEANAACQYNPSNGCLCYRGGAFVYPCTQVDTKCGMAGSGGASAAPPPAESGGFSAKIAVPPTQVCTCTAGNWSCSFGI